MATNRKVGDTGITLRPDVEANARHFITVVLERYAKRLNEDNIQCALDEEHLDDLWRFGPGSSNGVRGTHTAEKIAQPMTSTFLCLPLVLRLRAKNFYLNRSDLVGEVPGVVQVRGSRLTTVPKNEDTERTIAIEPSGNMALQLAAGRYLENVLRSIGLDIRDQQEKNKLLAKRGSVTGDLATIDMKSASDMIKIDLVRRLLPREWFDYLMAVRCHEIDVPGHGWVSLNMISTMGNGFTFPLMTFMFLALIYAYRVVNGGPTLWVDWSCTGVFGDDLVVRSCEAKGICETLEAAGLVVNADKSYLVGPFRESCGGDFYEGYDVTPVYIRSVETDADTYVVINQLMEWSARHNLLLHQTISLAVSFIRGKVHLVPEWYGSNQGVRTALCPRRFTYLKPLPVRVRLETSHFAMMLAVGGYLIPDGDDLFFSPRPYKTRMRVVSARLPRGYLSGEDPLTRSSPITTFIACYTPLLFAW
jgi:hypothetical protein